MDFDSLVHRPRLLLPERELWHGSPLVNPVRIRTQAAMVAQGIFAQSFDRNLWITGAQALATQQMEASGVYLYAGEVVTNVSYETTVAATSVTLGRIGLYKSDGTLLASCANDTAIWTAAAALRTKALSAPYTVLLDGFYYFGLLAVFTGTAPQVARGTNPSGAGTAIGAGLAPCLRQTGQTDLPSPATFAASTFNVWAGIS